MVSWLVFVCVVVRNGQIFKIKMAVAHQLPLTLRVHIEASVPTLVEPAENAAGLTSPAAVYAHEAQAAWQHTRLAKQQQLEVC